MFIESDFLASECNLVGEIGTICRLYDYHGGAVMLYFHQKDDTYKFY
jgi:peroxiredoxin